MSNQQRTTPFLCPPSKRLQTTRFVKTNALGSLPFSGKLVLTDFLERQRQNKQNKKQDSALQQGQREAVDTFRCLGSSFWLISLKKQRKNQQNKKQDSALKQGQREALLFCTYLVANQINCLFFRIFETAFRRKNTPAASGRLVFCYFLCFFEKKNTQLIMFAGKTCLRPPVDSFFVIFCVCWKKHAIN